jgi:hypothetical protein
MWQADAGSQALRGRKAHFSLPAAGPESTPPRIAVHFGNVSRPKRPLEQAAAPPRRAFIPGTLSKERVLLAR